MVRYEHTQRAIVLLVTFLASIFSLLALDMLVPGLRAMLVTIIGILTICGLIFSSLTIRITEQALEWQFGLGLIRKEVPLKEIEGVEVTGTTVLQGWGIHYTSRGWLYNVSGFRAIAVTLKNGKQFVLGTDEPEQLVAAIRRALP